MILQAVNWGPLFSTNEEFTTITGELVKPCAIQLNAVIEEDLWQSLYWVLGFWAV
jgi:hypothetical protein